MVKKGARPTVLLVDDDPRNLRLLDAMVAPLGVNAVLAAGGEEALALARQTRPDAILLDIMMPGTDGIEVCRRLKQDRALQSTPVVFVTALADTAHHAAAIEAGAVGFIAKPVHESLVEASVRSAVRMKQLSDEVEELGRQRASLTQMIVHDINNLLCTLLAGAELLQGEQGVSPEGREDLGAILQAGRDIQAMTASLLDIEKLESGSLPVSPRPLDGWALARARARLAQAQAEQGGLRLSWDEPSRPVAVLADPALLARVVDNLLFNALKFCPRGGGVRLDARPHEARAALSVENDGPPIPAEWHERIFERFAQLEARQATGRKGVGLGLAFAKLAMEAMGGSIRVESPLSGRSDGVRFVLELPAG